MTPLANLRVSYAVRIWRFGDATPLTFGSEIESLITVGKVVPHILMIFV